MCGKMKLYFQNCHYVELYVLNDVFISDHENDEYRVEDWEQGTDKYVIIRYIQSNKCDRGRDTR